MLLASRIICRFIFEFHIFHCRCLDVKVDSSPRNVLVLEPFEATG